jgi:hypothetical protein
MSILVTKQKRIRSKKRQGIPPEMPCPICFKKPEESDHRNCVFELFKTNVIKSVNEWRDMCQPKTIRKGRIRVMLPLVE